jgi:hypothetical protein
MSPIILRRLHSLPPNTCKFAGEPLSISDSSMLEVQIDCGRLLARYVREDFQAVFSSF